jgi:hypothetical protein
MAVSNFWGDKRIRRWSIIGAVLGGIAPLATLGEAVTVIDMALGALILWLIFGLATWVVIRLIDANQRKSFSTESDNNFTQIARWTSSPKFLPAVLIGILILVLAYATNTRSELWDRSIVSVWSSPGEEVLSGQFRCVNDSFNKIPISAFSSTECYAESGSWIRMPSSMSGPTMTDIDELVKQDFSENLHFIVVGLGLIGLLIYTSQKSVGRTR